MTKPQAPLLEVVDLHVDFRVVGVTRHAVRGVSFELEAGQTLAVLGESGSGKSVTAQAIMGLLDHNHAEVRGRVAFEGRELVGLTRSQRREYQGRRIAMIFQDALSALNPVWTAGTQIAEVLRVHSGLSRTEARRQTIELLERVRIPDAARRYDSFPHEMSGGMRQRVMIAIALALEPQVLIADEPTTALDVTVQAQILQLLAELRVDERLALLFITHDLSVSAEIADRVAVMYAGRIVETGATADVYAHPRHPYTVGLLDSAPRRARHGARLVPIPGSPPALSAIPDGCPFHPRCPLAIDLCDTVAPPLRRFGPAHASACYRAEEIGLDRSTA